MSSEQTDVEVGQPMPDCDIPLRADGTVEHGGYFLDPVQLHLVLGVDVSPWHERAIGQACDPDGSQSRPLWVWSLAVRQPVPVMGLSLWLRPGAIPLPDVAWMVPAAAGGLCCGCRADRAKDAMAQHDQLMDDRPAGMWGSIILVGRDHRVLGISQVACHGLLAALWQGQLVEDAAAEGELVGPRIDGFPSVMCHPAGQDQLMDAQELDQYLVAKGWREPASRRRLRAKRQRGRRRQSP
jgi:hypothetical protein